MPDARGEHGHAQVGGRIGVDQVLRGADGGLPGGRGPDGSGELALPAGPAQEDDELAGDPLGDLGAVVGLDERQREVDAGGDAGRGPHPAAAQEIASAWTSTAGWARGQRAARSASAW